jgi:uncharacterized protein YggL (DUF469 family)
MSSACPLLGFRVAMELAPATALAELRRAWLAFLGERGLVCTEGQSSERFECLVTSEAGQVTELDRSAAERWLDERDDVRANWLGPVHDLRPDS